MKVNPIVQAAREAKVQRVIDVTGCSRDEAISYLFAEEWFVADAITSFKVDCDIRAHRNNRIETRPL